jgi:hypothetical protein
MSTRMVEAAQTVLDRHVEPPARPPQRPTVTGAASGVIRSPVGLGSDRRPDHGGTLTAIPHDPTLPHGYDTFPRRRIPNRPQWTEHAPTKLVRILTRVGEQSAQGCSVDFRGIRGRVTMDFTRR